MGKLALLALVLLVIPLASAAVFINEVVPNPIDECKDCTEWLELYNSGDAAVDVDGWVLNDSTGHYVYINSNYTGAGTVVEAGGYLVLSDFSYGFKLRNKEETVRLLNGEMVVDEVSYSGFNAEASYDKAWARVSDGAEDWVKMEPTRGASNGAPEGDGDGDEGGDDNVEANVDDEGNGDYAGEEEEVASDGDEEEANRDAATLLDGEDEGERVVGRTIYVAEEKSDLTKPLLLLLLGLVVIAVLLLMQIASKKDG